MFSLIVISALLFNGALGRGNLDLTVLHVNDIHVRYEQTNTYGGTCKARDSCYGGLSRVHYKVNEIRNSEDNVIFLNGGDFYQGNIWYSHFKWRGVAHYGNILNFTAMALGNHEFDDRVEGLVPLLENATFPIICTNVDSTNEPKLLGKIPGSVVIQVQDRSVGIIGYVTKETDSISRPGKLLQFEDEVEAINKEANRLKEQGVDILIALGHSGYAEDKRIAAGVPVIDLVVGGHSHSFLYTTRNGVNLPSRERPEGDYPTIVTQNSGKRVPVVQAFAYTKYLGQLKLRINPNNQVVSWQGYPILLDESVPQDQNMLKEMASWKKEIQSYGDQVIGKTNILLLASRHRETNLGDFISDGMLSHLHPSQDTCLSLMNSGGIRGSIEIGKITREDLLTVLPFGNLIDIVKLRGRTLTKILEASVSRGGGGLLQVSGFKLVYHMWNSPGRRLYSAFAKRCGTANEYTPIYPGRLYNVAVPNYLTDGGDGYNLFDENEGVIKGITPDHVIMSKYIASKSPIDENSISDYGSRLSLQNTPSSYTVGASMMNEGFIMLITILHGLVFVIA